MKFSKEIEAKIRDFLRENAGDMLAIPGDIVEALCILAALPAASASAGSAAEAAEAERILRQRDEAVAKIAEFERADAERARRLRAGFFRLAAQLGRDALTVLAAMAAGAIRKGDDRWL